MQSEAAARVPVAGHVNGRGRPEWALRADHTAAELGLRAPYGRTARTKPTSQRQGEIKGENPVKEGVIVWENSEGRGFAMPRVKGLWVC